MALLTTNGERTAQRAAATVLHHVAHQVGARGFADDAPVQALAALAQAFDHRLGTVVRRAFLIAGDQKGDLSLVVRMVGGEAFHCDDHGGQAAFHVCRAATVEHALLVDARTERRVLPGLQRAGGNHVGMAGEAQHRAFVAANGPEVLHVLDVHRLDGEAASRQALAHQLLAAFVQRRHGGAVDQLAGQFERRGEGGGGHHGSGTAGKGRHIKAKPGLR